jgi:hypothetical protein
MLVSSRKRIFCGFVAAALRFSADAFPETLLSEAQGATVLARVLASRLT